MSIQCLKRMNSAVSVSPEPRLIIIIIIIMFTKEGRGGALVSSAWRVEHNVDGEAWLAFNVTASPC